MFAPFIDGINALRLHVYVRFGMWEEILAHPEYAEFRKASRALRREAWRCVVELGGGLAEVQGHGFSSVTARARRLGGG